MFKNKKLIFIFVFLIVFAFLYSFLSSDTIDNFYLYINEEEINKRKTDIDNIDYDSYGFSFITDYQEEVYKDVSNIIDEQIIKNDEIKVLNEMLNSIDNNGLEILKSYVDNINSSNNINEYVKNVANLENELSLNILTNITTDKNLHDNLKTIIYFMPITGKFDLPIYYYNTKNLESIVSLSNLDSIKLFESFGYSHGNAIDISNRLTNFYTDLSLSSFDINGISNYENISNIMSINELTNILSNIDFNEYLKLRNINEEYYGITDVNNYKKFNEYLTNDNLSLLKEYAISKVLEKYLPFTSSKNLEILNNYVDMLFDKENNTNNVIKNIIYEYYTNTIDYEYSTKNYDEENIKTYKNMVNEIIDYYKLRINEINWLSNDTKNKAILKLNNITPYIGYSDTLNTRLEKYNIDNSVSLLENIINVNNKVYRENIEHLKNNDIDPWIIPSTMVNAAYNPVDNSIIFPTAFTNIIDKNSSYYEKLGTIGMVISHEITHAFDSNGSLFDEHGNMNNWWNDEDISNYKELQEKIVKYYSDYKSSNVLKIDSNLTIDENIADLGAVNAITNIAKNNNATIDDYKLMYESFVKFWISNYISQYYLFSLQDVHSSNEIRVNATLSSIDKFYEVYNIKEDDLMYKNKEDRVIIW